MMLRDLQRATLAARKATGDQHLATQAHDGLVDITRTVPPVSGRGSYTVTVLVPDLTPAQAVAHLEGMAAK